jgi:hypothetical protein
MTSFRSSYVIAGLVVFGWCLAAKAESLEKPLQDKVDAKVKLIQSWAADPVIIAAVKAHNEKLSDEESAMNQDKWKGLSMLDPFVRGYTKNAAAQLIKDKKDPIVSEFFISGTDGKKIGFMSKPSNWSHLGKPKHDQPMAGQIWQGAVEVDESSGVQQVQVAVPVLDGGKAIGSMVVGLNLSKLKE